MLFKFIRNLFYRCFHFSNLFLTDFQYLNYFLIIYCKYIFLDFCIALIFLHDGSICSPPPAKTLYPEFASGPRAPSRATVPFLSTGLPLTLSPLALKATSDVKSQYLPSGLRSRPKYCFREAAVWAICSLWFNQMWPRGQIQVEQTWLPRAILCGWVQFSEIQV